jgi:hypothetical protein
MKRTALPICIFFLLFDRVGDGHLSKVKFVAPGYPVNSLNTSPEDHCSDSWDELILASFPGLSSPPLSQPAPPFLTSRKCRRPSRVIILPLSLFSYIHCRTSPSSVAQPNSQGAIFPLTEAVPSDEAGALGLINYAGRGAIERGDSTRLGRSWRRGSDEK